MLALLRWLGGYTAAGFAGLHQLDASLAQVHPVTFAQGTQCAGVHACDYVGVAAVGTGCGLHWITSYARTLTCNGFR